MRRVRAAAGQIRQIRTTPVTAGEERRTGKRSGGRGKKKNIRIKKKNKTAPKILLFPTFIYYYSYYLYVKRCINTHDTGQKCVSNGEGTNILITAPKAARKAEANRTNRVQW